MTIKEKAKQSGLPIEKVVELASASDINAEDTGRELEKSETQKLALAVKSYEKATSGTEDNKRHEVRFWTRATKHLIQAGNERIEFKDNVLVLDSERDVGMIALVRGLRNVNGKYSIYEVVDDPHEDESDEAVKFNELLEEIVFTGHSRERSKAGVKTVRALFMPDELEAMGENGFDPRRLIMKALRTKSLKLVSNNG